MAEPDQVVYEFDPISNVRDESGYWRLLNKASESCKITGTPSQEPTPTGISPFLIPLFAVGLISVAAMTESGTRGKK